MEIEQRIQNVYRPVEERVKDENEVERRLSDIEIFAQAKRCSNCGIPFCMVQGVRFSILFPNLTQLLPLTTYSVHTIFFQRPLFFPNLRDVYAPHFANPHAQETSMMKR